MKTCILFYLFCFCYGSVVFGCNTEVIYIGSGLMSYCQSPEAKDAPKAIVVDNDSNRVFLLYSMGMDANDVGGSFEKILAFIKKQGVR